MPIQNSDVAGIFNKVADLLEIKGENKFRIRAYRDAARTIGGLSKNVADMLKDEKDLSTLPGIGKDLAGKIKKIIKTGKLPLLSRLQKKIPKGLSDLMRISGLGAKRVKLIYDELNVCSLSDLKRALKKGNIRKLSGFGKSTEEKIEEGLKRIQSKDAERTNLAQAEQITAPLIEYLIKGKTIKDIEIAGSQRRKKETVKDADILVTVKKGSKVMERFTNYEDVSKVISKGATRSAILLKSGFQVDLRVVSEKSYGSALLYFTGSKAHNITLRKIALKKKYKMNEYGLFKKKGKGKEKSIAAKAEADVYKKLGLKYIEPELREDRGEIEAARKKNLPGLLTLDDIKGDLHTHTKLSDGHYTLKEMAEAAKKKGYSYFANTEHSKHVTVAGGIDAKTLGRQINKIDKLNKELEGINILKSIEVDILEDGRLDLPDSILKELDLVVCAVHYKFNLSKKKQTERIIKAMDNRYVNILAHPTGRLINERPPYDMDMERIMKEAKKRGCFLELDAHPKRLDLNDIHCKAAKDMGIKVAISTDAHTTDDLDLMRFGINQARRGWLEARDVINTRNLTDLRKLLKRR